MKHPLHKARKRHGMHNRTSKIRNIPFNLTFEEWYNWFLQNGIDKNVSQGPLTKNTLCMCRYGDTGPYSLDNIYCDTSSNNAKLARQLNPDSAFGGTPGSDGKHLQIKCQTPNGSFNSFNDAGKSHGVNPQTISNRIKNPNFPDYRLER